RQCTVRLRRPRETACLFAKLLEPPLDLPFLLLFPRKLSAEERLCLPGQSNALLEWKGAQRHRGATGGRAEGERPPLPCPDAVARPPDDIRHGLAVQNAV